MERATIEPAYSTHAAVIAGVADVVMFMQAFIKCVTVLCRFAIRVNRFFY